MSIRSRLGALEFALAGARGHTAWIDCANDGPEVHRVSGRPTYVLTLPAEHRGVIPIGTLATWNSRGVSTLAGGTLEPGEVASGVVEIRDTVMALLSERQAGIVRTAGHVVVTG